MIVVIAKIKAKQGQGDQLAEMFGDMVEWVTENEAGTLTYICNRSTRDPNHFVFYERYANQQAFEAHSGSDRFQDLVKQIQGKLDGPLDMEMFDEVAGKL